MHKKVCLSGEVRIPHARVKTSNGDTVTEEKKVEKIDPKLCSKYPELFEPHTFAPKDLLALLKNLEHEISMCETSLKDENDKRNKYKVRKKHWQTVIAFYFRSLTNSRFFWIRTIRFSSQPFKKPRWSKKMHKIEFFYFHYRSMIAEELTITTSSFALFCRCWRSKGNWLNWCSNI